MFHGFDFLTILRGIAEKPNLGIFYALGFSTIPLDFTPQPVLFWG
jgi:hypothetical protein